MICVCCGVHSVVYVKRKTAYDLRISDWSSDVCSSDLAIAMLNFVIADFEQYFGALTADRRANPREDIATVIANAMIGGEPIPDRELAGYYMIIATAGHDTTSASTAGAIMELAKDPALFARFRDAESDKAGLIGEGIRWTTPVQHFMRSAREEDRKST